MTTRFNDPVVFTENVAFTGTIGTLPNSVVYNANVASTAAIERAKLAEDSNAVYVVPFEIMRIHDAFQTLLPGTSSGNDLALVGGTFGTNSPTLQTADLKAGGATTNYARFTFALPPEYIDGGSVTVRVFCGMKTTVADTTATIDVECYESDKQEGVGADLCTTAATSCNSLTLANKDFAITSTGLARGDVLDIRLASAINDGGTGTAVIGMIGCVSILLDIKG